jgi:hypothetical protein
MSFKNYINESLKVIKINENKFLTDIDTFRRKLLTDDKVFQKKTKSIKNSDEYDYLYQMKMKSIDEYKDIDEKKLVKMIAYMLRFLLKREESLGQNYIYRELVIPTIGKNYHENDNYGKLIHAFVPNSALECGWFVEGSAYNKTPLSELDKFDLVIIFSELKSDPVVIDGINNPIYKKINNPIYKKINNPTNESLSENEEWKVVPIEGYSNYEASNLGRIRHKRGNILSTYIKKRSKSIVMVGLRSKGVKKDFILSQVIAKTFLKGSGSAVIHKDGNKENNRVENLKYTDNPSKYASKFSDKPSGHDAHDSYTIHQYDLMGNFIKTHGSIGQAGKVLGIPTTNISKVAKGKRNSAGGYIWKYDKTVNQEYKGVAPEKIKEIRDYYAMNDVNFSDIWRKYKIVADSYGAGRIIKGIVYKTDMYLSDRAKELISTYNDKTPEEIKHLMKINHRYFITNQMLEV